MSTPLWDLPDHLKMGFTEEGDGPVLETDPDFDHWACWCGKPGCMGWILDEEGWIV